MIRAKACRLGKRGSDNIIHAEGVRCAFPSCVAEGAHGTADNNGPAELNQPSEPANRAILLRLAALQPLRNLAHP